MATTLGQLKMTLKLERTAIRPFNILKENINCLVLLSSYQNKRKLKPLYLKITTKFDYQGNIYMSIDAHYRIYLRLYVQQYDLSGHTRESDVYWVKNQGETIFEKAGLK